MSRYKKDHRTNEQIMADLRQRAAEKIDPATLHEARPFAASFERRLIDSIKAGETVCNDPERWIEDLEASVIEIEAGRCDHNFTIRQRMEVFITGQSRGLLACPSVNHVVRK